MYIDFKTTMWHRIRIPEGHEDKVLEMLKNGADPYEIQEMSKWEFYSEPMYDTREFIPASESNDYTIQVQDASGNDIWNNKHDKI